MSDDWYREQSRLDQMRQDQQFREQMLRNQQQDTWRIDNERENQRNIAAHEERRRRFEDESRERRNTELQELMAGFQPVPHNADTERSHRTSGGTGGTRQLTWGQVVIAGLFAGAAYLAKRYEEQAQRHPDTPR